MGSGQMVSCLHQFIGVWVVGSKDRKDGGTEGRGGWWNSLHQSILIGRSSRWQGRGHWKLECINPSREDRIQMGSVSCVSVLSSTSPSELGTTAIRGRLLHQHGVQEDAVVGHVG